MAASKAVAHCVRESSTSSTRVRRAGVSERQAAEQHVGHVGLVAFGKGIDRGEL